MYELIYRNLETGILMKDYGFQTYEEKRRAFLLEQDNYEIVSCKRLLPPLFSAEWWRYFWKCATCEKWDITP
jgi:hypothetical protein